MTVRNISAMTGALALSISLSGCASNIETPFVDPVGFNAASYCEIDRTSDLTIPAAVTAMVDGENVDEEALAEALLIKGAMEIAHESETEETCRSVFAEGDRLFHEQLQLAQDNASEWGSFDRARDDTLLAVQTDITRLWREDQSARNAMIALRRGDDSLANRWAQRRSVGHGTRIDAMATKAIAAYADDYGWIDTKRFGEDVSAHAWILVQHADDHPEFQAEILAKMKPYVDRGETSLRNFAYLWDRVAVNTGQLQRYGTQPNWECDENGKMELRPLEDPETVNERRAEMGLNTVEEGLAGMEASVCG